MIKFFSKSEYQEIADIFGLGKIQKIKYFRKGFQTPKVAVETKKGEFVISKNQPDRSPQDEIKLLGFLRNLQVPKYVKSEHNNWIERYKGSLVAACSFLEGVAPKKITPAMAFQIGKFLGDFHKQGERLKKTFSARRKFYVLPEATLKEMSAYVMRQKNLSLKKIVDEVRSGVVKNRLPKSLPSGPVHVDVKPENELFINDRLTGIIDFGNFYIDVFVLDIGKAMMWNCIFRKKLDIKLVDALIDGYESKRILSRSEKSHLFRAIAFAIYSHIWVDLYNVPLGYVPESYTRYLVKEFLPAARNLDRVHL